MTTNDRPLLPAHAGAADPGEVDMRASQASAPGSYAGEVVILAADDGAGRPLPWDQRQSWCCALLELVLAGAGHDASTGRPLLGRVSAEDSLPLVHYVPSCILARSSAGDATEAPGAFLVILPSAMDEEDAVAVLAALTGLTRLRSGTGRMRLQVVPGLVPADRFWQAPAEGMTRLWASPAELDSASAIGCVEDALQLRECDDDRARVLSAVGGVGGTGAGVLVPVDLPHDLVACASGLVW